MQAAALWQEMHLYYIEQIEWYYDQRRVFKRRVDKQRVDKQRVDKRRVELTEGR